MGKSIFTKKQLIEMINKINNCSCLIDGELILLDDKFKFTNLDIEEDKLVYQDHNGNVHIYECAIDERDSVEMSFYGDSTFDAILKSANDFIKEITKERNDIEKDKNYNRYSNIIEPQIDLDSYDDSISINVYYIDKEYTKHSFEQLYEDALKEEIKSEMGNYSNNIKSQDAKNIMLFVEMLSRSEVTNMTVSKNIYDKLIKYNTTIDNYIKMGGKNVMSRVDLKKVVIK